MRGSRPAWLRPSAEQAAVFGALVLLTAASWLWLVRAPMPMPHAGEVRDLGYASLTLVMWFVMMVAMMTPSVAPTVLLFARVARRAAQGARSRIAAFLAGYFTIWLGFSIVATVLQIAWIEREMIDAMGVSVRPWATSLLLAAAAVYQLTPVKRACLAHCRSPVQFLAGEYRPGLVGAWTMGGRHGVYCVGCCWALMLLLFVGGVMNLPAVLGLAALVLLEKVAPFGNSVRLVSALALAGAAVYVLR